MLSAIAVRQRCSCFTSFCNQNERDIKECKETGKIKELLCANCNIGIGINVNGIWKPLEDILKDDKGRNGWIKVSEVQDQLCHLVLSQIIYKEHEVPNEEFQEVSFDFPDAADVIMIRYFKGKAIGFYSVKVKGTFIAETREYYTMNVLDTAYIQREYRRKGFGIEILESLSSTFSGPDIGFSKPISFSMLQVLKKYLQMNAGDRSRFWEVEGTGSEGNKTLIWYNIKRYEKNKEQK